MNDKQITLKTLGLKDTDIKIISHLKNKPKTLADLSIEIGIPRTSLYHMVMVLENKEMLTNFISKGKKYWKIVDAEKMKQNLDIAKKYILSKTDLEDTTPLSSGDSINPYVTVLSDQDLIKVFYDLSNQSRGSRFVGIQPGSSLTEVIKHANVEDIVNINNNIKKNKIIADGIVHEESIGEIKNYADISDAEKILESFGGRAADTVKLPKDYLADTKAEFYSYNNKTAIMNWEKGFAVVITDPDVHELMTKMCESVKYLLNKYDQNERIAKELIDLKSM